MPTFFRKFRQRLLTENRVKKYLLYAIGEIALVVIGILIALQVNSWYENKKLDERFLFGLRSLYAEIRASTFYESSLEDKLNFQLVRIDSLLEHPEEIDPERLPAIILLCDETAIDVRNNQWKSEYLEIVPGNERRNDMARSLRGVIFGWETVAEELKVYNLYKAMAGYLRQFDIPFQIYHGGTGYEEFIQLNSSMGYTSHQLENVQKLIRDPSFIADLMTLRESKKRLLDYIEAMGFSAQEFLDYVEAYDPGTNFELNRMEIIGTGMPQGNWASGALMHRADPEDEMIWEIEHELVSGLVKFRSDVEWILDWGKGENNPDMLVFKGGDITVTPGYYHIRIDLRENTMEFKPISRP